MHRPQYYRPIKLLLDERMPHHLVPFQQALTLQKMKWCGKKTGELQQLLAEHGVGLFSQIARKMRCEQN